MPILRRVRRLFRVLTAACSGCGLVLRERRRNPCPACGSLSRTFDLSLSDAMRAEARTS